MFLYIKRTLKAGKQMQIVIKMCCLLKRRGFVWIQLVQINIQEQKYRRIVLESIEH